MDPAALKTLFAFLFGLTLGSFLNVCIYRVPLGKSIIRPPSSCPSCGKGIRFYDNIPIISYIILLGKCRYCKHHISIRYPVVELLAGLLSAALFLRYGLSVQYFSYFFFLSSLTLISFIDLQHQIIPDVISLPGVLLGFALSILKVYQITWHESLIGIIAGGGSLFLIAVVYKKLTGKEGMGGGDVKLLAMIGAWMGWKALPYVVFISSVTGTLIGGGSLLLAGRSYRSKIPFGPFLALGALVFFFFGNELLLWYYRIIL